MGCRGRDRARRAGPSGARPAAIGVSWQCWAPELDRRRSARIARSLTALRAPRAEPGTAGRLACTPRAVGGARAGVLDRDRRRPRRPLGSRCVVGGGAQVRAVLGLVAGAVAVGVGLGDRVDRQLAAALDLRGGAAVGRRASPIARPVDVDGLGVADVAFAVLGLAARLGRRSRGRRSAARSRRSIVAVVVQHVRRRERRTCRARPGASRARPAWTRAVGRSLGARRTRRTVPGAARRAER